MELYNSVSVAILYITYLVHLILNGFSLPPFNYSVSLSSPGKTVLLSSPKPCHLEQISRSLQFFTSHFKTWFSFPLFLARQYPLLQFLTPSEMFWKRALCKSCYTRGVSDHSRAMHWMVLFCLQTRTYTQ